MAFKRSEPEGEAADSDLVVGDLSTDLFIEFLTEKSVHTACPVCTVDDWHVAIERDENGPGFSGGIPDSVLERYIPVGVVSCSNCGYVRLFNREAFSAWGKRKRD